MSDSPAPDPFAAVDEIYERFAREEHVPGLVAGVVQAGQLTHLKAIGAANLETGVVAGPDTAFRIASMTKSFVALAVLMLRDAGRLDLDGPIDRYIPEARALKAPTADSPPVTVRKLLTHTAGFVTDDAWADRNLGISRQGFSELITMGGLSAQAPGIAFEYSNLGYALLGRILTNIAGEPFQLFIRDNLVRPLGMEKTTFDYFEIPEADRALPYRWSNEAWSPERPEPDGDFGAIGGLVTTARDYARYVAFLLDAWPARDAPETGPVRRASVRELGLVNSPALLPTVYEADGKPVAISNTYGYGMVTSADSVLGRYLHHAGGLPGYGSHVLISPETGTGLFAFANRTYAAPVRGNWEAAAALKRAGAWTARRPELDPRLRRAAEAARAAYNAGRIEAAMPLLACNLLPDEPVETRDAELAKLKDRFGEAGAVRVEPRHSLAGRLVLECAKGELNAELALAPGPTPQIQTLRFQPET